MDDIGVAAGAGIRDPLQGRGEDDEPSLEEEEYEKSKIGTNNDDHED
jgi:hypothetical protein